MENKMLTINLFFGRTKLQLNELLRAFIAMAFMIVCITQAAEAVPRKLKRECRSDYKLLCPLYKIGTSKMRSCMRSNGRQLSWGCYQALKDYGYVKRRKGS